MRELYIQGKGKIDCDMILSALLGLGADPEEIRERLEKIFSLPVRLEKPLVYAVADGRLSVERLRESASYIARVIGRAE